MVTLTATPSHVSVLRNYLQRRLDDIEREKALIKQIDNGCTHVFIPDREHTQTEYRHRELDKITHARRGFFSAEVHSTPIYGLSSSSADKEIKSMVCNKCLLMLNHDDYTFIGGVTDFAKTLKKNGQRRKELELVERVIDHPQFMERLKIKNMLRDDYSFETMLEIAKSL